MGEEEDERRDHQPAAPGIAEASVATPPDTADARELPRRRGSRRRERHPRHRKQLHVVELVRLLLKIHKLTDIVREHSVYVFWDEMVDEQIAKNTSPDSLCKGVLRVSAKNSVWAHEARFYSAQTITQINKWVGGPPLVSDIRFSLGTQRKAVDHDQLLQKFRRAQQQRQQSQKPPPLVSQADQEAIRAETRVIEDDELRATIERVRVTWNR